MADHLTEEEQIEAIKRWWDNNWLSVVVPIVAAALLYTGWNFYGDHKKAQAEKASDEYQALIELIQPVGEAAFSDELKAEAGALAADIQKQYAGSMYADLAAMVSARIAVQDNNYAAASEALQAVVDNGSNEAVIAVAKARLARVEIAAGDYDAALALVAPSQSESVQALYAEIRGDAYVAKAEPQNARTAYQQALGALTPQQFAQRGIIQFKLDGLAPAESLEPALPSESEG
ncbi:YfgM family protein [Agaribacterium haliotis]|uniref:YfgM family protein n=1 Tax=Agaribacterium haliotis TaxID=2013869 RepID=UPI000BB56813|nr:tetratricopeptide repeat protein [Agaribacterium haliotis]